MTVDAQTDSPAVRFRDAVKANGLERRAEPVILSSGTPSRDFVDVKRALAAGADLNNAAQAVLDELGGIEFDAVGGLTLGADHIGAAIAMCASAGWFVVRKEPKTHGLRRTIEGVPVSEGTRVVVIDDVITTGGSILQAYDRVTDAGTVVVAAVTLVDRGNHACSLFAERGVPYFAVVNYDDLGIEPV